MGELQAGIGTSTEDRTMINTLEGETIETAMIGKMLLALVQDLHVGTNVMTIECVGLPDGIQQNENAPRMITEEESVNGQIETIFSLITVCAFFFLQNSQDMSGYATLYSMYLYNITTEFP